MKAVSTTPDTQRHSGSTESLPSHPGLQTGALYKKAKARGSLFTSIAVPNVCIYQNACVSHVCPPIHLCHALI